MHHFNFVANIVANFNIVTNLCSGSLLVCDLLLLSSTEEFDPKNIWSEGTAAGIKQLCCYNCHSCASGVILL